MRPNAFQKILSLIYLILIAVSCIFYVPFRDIHGRYDTEIVYDAIWSGNSNIDLYRIGICLLVLSVIFYFLYRYLNKMNDLEVSIYKRKAKGELTALIVFISGISVCLLFLVGTNVTNQFRWQSLMTDIQNIQNTIKEEIKNKQIPSTDMAETTADNQQDPPSKQLWEKLNSSKAYTNSYEEFQKRYSKPKDINTLYQKLSDAKAYTNSQGDFYKKYFPAAITDNQQNKPSKVSKLYNSLLSEGYTVKNLGTENEFTKALTDTVKANKIYSSLISDGYTEKNLGTKNEFLSTFNIPVKNKGTSQVPTKKYKVTQQVLADFSATVAAKPYLTKDELLSKFPEFNNDAVMLQFALDYAATDQSGKYKSVDELNSKFPEFDFTSPIAGIKPIVQNAEKKSDEDVQKQERVKYLNVKLNLYETKKDSLIFFNDNDIRRITLIWLTVLFGILYIMRPLLLFIKGIFAELK